MCVYVYVYMCVRTLIRVHVTLHMRSSQTSFTFSRYFHCGDVRPVPLPLSTHQLANVITDHNSNTLTQMPERKREEKKVRRLSERR